MKQTLGVVMNSIQTISIKKDTTFAMLLEVQRRNWPIFYMEQGDLFLRNEVPYGRMRALDVRDDPKNWFQCGKEEIKALDNLSVILMRKDPPVDIPYIYTTQLLSKAEQKGVLVVNSPQGLRDFNEKLFALHFSQCCPPTLVSTHLADTKEFLERYKDIIIKPLEGMGGRSVFRLRQNDPNINAILETFSTNNHSYVMAQRYIPEITAGDKRILMIQGEPVPYALARIPAPGETRANLAVGGQGIGRALSEHDRWICGQVGPVLKQQGLVFVGLDVIGDYLTEINITSPTGIRELDAEYGINIAGQFMDKIEDLLLKKKSKGRKVVAR